MKTESRRRNLWTAIGPAIITASVVLGPGSILSSSKIGYQFGYSMAWVLALAILMMIGMTALSARLGVLLDDTLCAELARRVGRPAAAITGISLFLIAACFQFGNNLGVLAAIEPFLSTPADGEPPEAWMGYLQKSLNLTTILLLNILVVVALFGFKQLYQPVERMMKFLVTVMMIGFAGNLIMARPDLLAFLGGLVPQLPEGAASTLLPQLDPAVIVDGVEVEPATIRDNLTPVIAMFATTFSIAGAFYQSYLVRQKGWTANDLGKGFLDSTVGILIVGAVTAMIMLTAAAVLHDNPSISEPKSAADVARQLEPLFGPAAKVLFCLGIFAGAASSFLVNAMIGGTVLSDGLGLGGNIDQKWPKRFTVLALVIGMGVALLVEGFGMEPVKLIIFAQAMTVLGLPALAISILYLSFVGSLRGKVPGWLRAVAVVAVVIVIFLALRTGLVLFYKLTS